MFSLAAGLMLVSGVVHNHLVKSDPAKGAKLTASPAEIKLWFSERPEVGLTTVTLLRPDSSRVASLKAVATPDTLVVSAPLSTPLPAGDYIVSWRTSSGDGHVIRGRFGFSISP